MGKSRGTKNTGLPSGSAAPTRKSTRTGSINSTSEVAKGLEGEITSPPAKKQEPRVPPTEKEQSVLGAVDRELSKINPGLNEEDEDSSSGDDVNDENSVSEEGDHVSESEKQKGIPTKKLRTDSRPLQLGRDAKELSKKLKEDVEEEKKRNRAHASSGGTEIVRSSEYSKEQIDKMKQYSKLVSNLKISMMNLGEPVSKEELNEALELFKREPNVDYSQLLYFLKGVRRGEWLKMNKGEDETKKVNDMFLTTHKHYSATLKGFERLLSNSTAAMRGATAVPQSVVVPKPTNPGTAQNVIPVAKGNKRKVPEPPKKPEADVKSSEPPMTVELTELKRTGKEIVAERDLDDYCELLRTSCTRLIKHYKFSAESLMAACSSFKDEEWNEVESDISKLDKMERKVVKKAIELEKVEEEKKEKDGEKEKEKEKE